MLWSSIFVTFVAKKIHWIVTWILPEYSSNPFEHCIALGDSSLIESFLSIIFTQINQLTLQSVEISLHGCVIIGTSCFTHALCHMNQFAKNAAAFFRKSFSFFASSSSFRNRRFSFFIILYLISHPCYNYIIAPQSDGRSYFSRNNILYQ